MGVTLQLPKKISGRNFATAKLRNKLHLRPTATTLFYVYTSISLHRCAKSVGLPCNETIARAAKQFHHSLLFQLVELVDDGGIRHAGA